MAISKSLDPVLHTGPALGRVPPAPSEPTRLLARTLLVSPTNGPLAGETMVTASTGQFQLPHMA